MSSQEPKILEADIRELDRFGLSYTLIDPLYEAGLRTGRDVLDKGKKVIENIPNVGPIRYAQIEEVFKNHGVLIPD